MCFSHNFCLGKSTFLLWFQKDMIEESIEIVIEKLLHANKDDVAKVIFFTSLSDPISLASLVSTFYILFFCL